jgi:hypothetical protein
MTQKGRQDQNYEHTKPKLSNLSQQESHSPKKLKNSLEVVKTKQQKRKKMTMNLWTKMIRREFSE